MILPRYRWGLLGLAAVSILLGPGCATATSESERASRRDVVRWRVEEPVGKAQPLTEGPPVDLGPRCVKVCLHIAQLAGDAPESWLVACRERCAAHASVGQLTCYEQAVRAEELSACMVD